MGAVSTPKQVFQQVADDLVAGLNLKQGQVKVAMARFGGWVQSNAGPQYPILLVVPGPVRADQGSGWQEGGNLLRRVYFTIVINLGTNISQKDQQSLVLTGQQTTILDWTESVINLFRYVYLNGLLLEPMTYEGESDIIVETNDHTTFRKEITFSVLINTPLPSVANLNQ